MKKYICNPLWLLLLFVAFISSCDKEEIVFDHVWGIERSVFFNGREKWAKDFENQRV